MWKLAEDTLGQADLDAVADWLRTGPRLTQGELVREFERAWSDWLGVSDSVFVSSGTTANFALVQAAALRVDSARPKVGVASVTWSTNITPSLLLGHDVVVFDVDRRTLGVDIDQVVAAMDDGLLDILFVTHLLGFDALAPAIVDAAERNGVILLEDCCESHGARHGDRKVGSVGLGSTFSFYFGHHMSTIEGGMISTDDSDLADDLRLLRAHGLARESARFDDYAANHPDLDRRFLFILPGLNFRSTELNAFLGLRQLEVIDERIAIRNDNMRRFLDRAPDTIWRDYETAGMSSFAFPIIARDQADRAGIQQVTADLGIETRPVVAGNLLEQPFMDRFDVSVFGGPPEVAAHIHEAGLYAGNGHHVTLEMVDALCDHLQRLG